jgi:hypothetical protein
MGPVAPTITMGMVWLALRAASALGVPPATIRSTFASASSAARCGSRSYRPSAHRYSNVMLRPSTHPRSRSSE